MCHSCCLDAEWRRSLLLSSLQQAKTGTQHATRSSNLEAMTIIALGQGSGNTTQLFLVDLRKRQYNLLPGRAATCSQKREVIF